MVYMTMKQFKKSKKRSQNKRNNQNKTIKTIKKKVNSNSHRVRNNKINQKRKEENLDHFHIAPIIMIGKRKIDYNKVKKYIQLPEGILIYKKL